MAASEGLKPGNQLGERERLGQIVIRAEAEAEDFLVHSVDRC